MNSLNINCIPRNDLEKLIEELNSLESKISGLKENITLRQ